MKIFYFCLTGHHTSVIASALHLGTWPGERAGFRELYRLPGFDMFEFREIGRPWYAGTDHCGHEVFTVGVWRESKIMQRTLHDFVRLLGIPPGEWEVVDTTPYVSRWTVLGLKLKRIRLHRLARAFFYLGARQEAGQMAKALPSAGPKAFCHQ